MKIIKKDITSIEEGFILHQVNCQNAMGSGVAKAIYTKWPNVKVQYHSIFTREKPETLFHYLQTVKASDKITVFNSFTQFYYGNSEKTGIVYTDMEWLYYNITVALKLAERNNSTLYIPEYVGCGLAGGNWDELLNKLKDLSDNLIICSIR